MPVAELGCVAFIHPRNPLLNPSTPVQLLLIDTSLCPSLTWFFHFQRLKSVFSNTGALRIGSPGYPSLRPTNHPLREGATKKWEKRSLFCRFILENIARITSAVPCHSLFKGHNVIVDIVVLNCQKCIQCHKCQVSGHKYRGLPFEGVL